MVNPVVEPPTPPQPTSVLPVVSDGAPADISPQAAAQNSATDSLADSQSASAPASNGIQGEFELRPNSAANPPVDSQSSTSTESEGICGGNSPSTLSTFCVPESMAAVQAWGYCRSDDGRKIPCDLQGRLEAQANNLCMYSKLIPFKRLSSNWGYRFSFGGKAGDTVIEKPHSIGVMDFDHVLDPKTGTYTCPPELQQLIEELRKRTFCEISVSRTGIHAYFDATKVRMPQKANGEYVTSLPKGNPEIYTGDRYIWFTGNAYGADEVKAVDDLVQPIIDRRNQSISEKQTVLPSPQADGGDNPRADSHGIYEAFNRLHPLSEMLKRCGYRPDPSGDPTRWSRPDCKDDDGGIHILDGMHFFVHNATDIWADETHDAYDLYLRYLCEGDAKLAEQKVTAEVLNYEVSEIDELRLKNAFEWAASQLTKRFGDIAKKPWKTVSTSTPHKDIAAEACRIIAQHKDACTRGQLNAIWMDTPHYRDLYGNNRAAEWLEVAADILDDAIRQAHEKRLGSQYVVQKMRDIIDNRPQGTDRIQALVGEYQTRFPGMDKEILTYILYAFLGGYDPHATMPIIQLTGEKGAGKSSYQSAIRDLTFTDDSRYMYGKVTTAQFYRCGQLISLSLPSILLLDDQNIAANDEMQGNIKRLTDSGKGQSFLWTDKLGYSQRTPVPDRVMLCTTKVTLMGDDQIIDRSLIIEIPPLSEVIEIDPDACADDSFRHIANAFWQSLPYPIPTTVDGIQLKVKAPLQPRRVKHIECIARGMAIAAADDLTQLVHVTVQDIRRAADWVIAQCSQPDDEANLIYPDTPFTKRERRVLDVLIKLPTLQGISFKELGNMCDPPIKKVSDVKEVIWGKHYRNPQGEMRFRYDGLKSKLPDDAILITQGRNDNEYYISFNGNELTKERRSELLQIVHPDIQCVHDKQEVHTPTKVGSVLGTFPQHTSSNAVHTLD